MDDWVRRLLGGYLPDHTITAIEADYQAYEEIPLRRLGLDSIAVMGLVLNIESSFDRPVDYESFDISALETLRRAKEYLHV